MSPFPSLPLLAVLDDESVWMLPWLLVVLLGAIGIWRELSVRRLARRLRESEARMHAAIEGLPFSFWATDSEGRYTLLNSTTVERWGNQVGKRLDELNHPQEVLDWWQENRRRAFAGEIVRSEGDLEVNGERRSYENIVAPIRDGDVIRGILGVSIDITDRKQAAAAQLKTEQRFRALVENSADAISILDPEGSTIYASPAGARMLGYTVEELLGKATFDSVHPDDRAFAARQLDQSRRQPGAGVTVHSRVLHHNGSWRMMEGTFTNLLDDPSVCGIVCNYRDVTDRATAQKALRESEARFQAFVDHSPAIIFMKDPTGRYLHVNARFEKVFGLPAAQIIGRSDEELFSPEQAHRFTTQDRKTFAADCAMEFEETTQCPDGARTSIVLIFPLHDASGQITALCGIGTDITDRRHLEEQLRQSQRMEAIGQLAGGVAHDFNNLLTVIQGHASLIELAEGLSADVAESVEQISLASERAANLTSQLLAFGRRQLLHPRELDLNEVVADMSKMLRRLLGEDVTLECTAAPALPAVLADVGMIEQVLLNLAVNARDAMPGGGRLGIDTAHRHFRAGELPPATEALAGQFVVLSVSDTGSGIAPENLPHIFEPFFTTKDVGKGTGLGLATVYGIVKQHHGWIEVAAGAGRGTVFRIYFPASTTPAVRHSAAATLPDLRGGAETILVVEDEEPVRLLTCNILRRLGYRVLEAATGVAAVAVWGAEKDSIDLVLTDLVMPDGMSGRELAATLLVDRPDLPVIYTSGYSAEIAGKGSIMEEGVNFLRKPYPVSGLTTLVRARLDAVEKVSKVAVGRNA